MVKIFLTLIIFLFSFAANASNLAITGWQENTSLTKSGKNSEILIQGKVGNLLPNQAMTSFSIGFDPNRQIKITKVICDNKLADYSFSNNSLNLKFTQAKANNSAVSLYFSYEETYDKIDETLRQEIIDIPPFAVGANSKVVISFPWFLESATLNPNITKSGNSFIYQNVVPKDGVREIIKLTAAQSIWDVAVKIKVSADKALNKISVTMPSYFQNGGQKVANFVITSSTQSMQQSNDGSNVILKLNSGGKEILIKNQARISTGKNNLTPIFRDPTNYLNFTQEESALLSPILEQIKQNPQYRDLPLYAKIGKFVHEFIKYDESYVGKLPTIKRILQNPIGVCTEYSNLYNSLARLAGIPSIVIDGAACGEYEECKGHAWNMIYYDNRWINVDATWDLMSGIVSSSHVYFSEHGKGGIEVQYLDDQKILNSQMDFEMKSAL